MRTKMYCVRVVQTMKEDGSLREEGGPFGTLLECLRYAGVVTIHDTDPHGLTTVCFDIESPRYTTNSKTWSEMNAERMRSFGYNAVSAPSTLSE